MLELSSSGSARGVCSNVHPYRDPPPSADVSNLRTYVGFGAYREPGDHLFGTVPHPNVLGGVSVRHPISHTAV
jgi:hypothetical protein